jgi:hypothetical protein
MVTAQNPPAQMKRPLALVDDSRLSSGADAPSAHERWVKAIVVNTKAISPEISSMRGRMITVILLPHATANAPHHVRPLITDPDPWARCTEWYYWTRRMTSGSFPARSNPMLLVANRGCPPWRIHSASAMWRSVRAA